MKDNIRKIAVVGTGFHAIEALRKIKELEAEGFKVIEAKDLKEEELPFVEKIEMPIMDRIELTPKRFPRAKSKFHK